jgi:predicted phage terminase large subunit-like protein
LLDLDFENGLAPEVRAVLTSKLLTDFGFFTRFFFKHVYGRKFIMAPHHRQIIEKMKAVARGDIRRLIINIPPRYGKTELAVKMFIAWCIANNPRAKFMHLSYADSLVKDNSDAIRDIIKSPAFRYLFPESQMSTKTDSKEKWYTTKGGGLYAVSTGSPITGFGAGDFGDRQYQGTGSDADGFGGCIIIDDPLKPADKDSELKRERINSRYNNTIASRVNNPGVTPVVLIMQRLHDHDMAGFLMEGGSGEPWEVLSLPAINEDGTPLWPEKHSIEQLETMRDADPETFASQMMQSPMVATGNIFKREWFRFYNDASLPRMFDKKFQSWDFTFKASASSDNVCGLVIGKKGPYFYILDYVCGKMTFTESVKAMMLMTEKHPDAIAKYVEAKANGEAVMDTLTSKINGIIGVNPKESKLARAHAVTPLFQAGNVLLPENAPWVYDYIDELTKFPNATHDDRVDATTQGLSQEMMNLSLWDVL